MLLVSPRATSFLRHYVRRFAAALPGDAEVAVLCGDELWRDDPRGRPAIDGPGVVVPPPAAEAQLYEEAARRAIEGGADRLHVCFLSDPAALAGPARRCAHAGVAVSASVFGLAELRDGAHRRALVELLGVPSVRALLVHSNDPGRARRVAARAGLPIGDRLAFVHDPVYDEPAAYRCDQRAARRELGLGGDDAVVLCFGALSRRKGAAVLLDACRRLTARPAIRVLVAGAGGDAAPDVRGALRGLPDVVCVERFLDDAAMASCFAAADVVALPYTGAYRDATSGVLVQAALAGRPVVVPAIPPFADVVERHGVGRTYGCEDAADLARVLGEVAAPGGGRRAPGWAGYLAGIESWPRLAELAAGPWEPVRAGAG